MEKIPDSEFQDRVKRLQQKMEEKNLEVIFAFSDEYNLAPVRYFTDYWPALEKAAVLVSQEGKLLLLVAPEGEPLARETSRLGEIINVREFMIEGEEYPRADYFEVRELLKRCCGGKLPSRLGLIGREFIPQAVYEKVSQAASGAEVINADPLFDELRMIKSPAEEEMLDRAFALSQSAMDCLVQHIHEGVRECEAAAAAEKVMRDGGAEWYAYNTIVSSGARCRNVLGRASGKKFRKGEMVLLGVGARYEGYCSAVGHNVVVGEATQEQEEYLQVGKVAQELAYKELRPGALAREVDRAARTHIREKGLGDYHLYSVGHGIGITECFEGPYCTPRTELVLAEGMTLCIDIGIFGDPQHGGQRVEDGFIITARGARKLGSR